MPGTALKSAVGAADVLEVSCKVRREEQRSAALVGVHWVRQVACPMGLASLESTWRRKVDKAIIDTLTDDGSVAVQ